MVAQGRHERGVGYGLTFNHGKARLREHRDPLGAGRKHAARQQRGPANEDSHQVTHWVTT